MNFFSKVLFVCLLSAGISAEMSGQVASKLPRSIPELEGVSSAGIVDFLNAADTSGLEIHSFMFIRHGKVIAEGWWDPYGPDYKHLMFSASKTFTATAVGFAVAENKLKVTDKVISFFPYSLPDTISGYIKDLTVQNLLTMSVGQDPEPSSMGMSGDWITGFLKTNPVDKPCILFLYNNMATFMLSAIVQQATGEKVFDYLMPRLFKPLGIRGIDWDQNPQGITLGMIGLRLHTEDLAKIGLFLLQEGVWNNQPLLPKAWVKEATSFKIKNSDIEEDSIRIKDEWAQGYAYQMWLGRNNTVRVDGMGGQFSVLIPDKDALVVFTASVSNTQKQLNLMHEYLIPAILSDKALAPDPAAHQKVQRKTEALSLSPGFSKISDSDFDTSISGKEFVLGTNNYGIQSVYFAFNDKECTFALKRDNAIHSVKAGLEGWLINNTSSASLLSSSNTRRNAKSVDANYTILQPVIKLAARYSWTDQKTLEITGRFVEESLNSETIVCKFSEQNGNVRLTIEPKAAGSQTRAGGMMQPAVLRGSLVKIQ